MMKRFLKDEIGSVTILFALGLTVFLGCAALVTDVGLVYLADAKLTNAVDAAVLAGAQELPGRPEVARSQAIAYAVANGINPDHLAVDISNGNRKIKVTAQRDVRLFFANYFGVNSAQVDHMAAAEVGFIVGVNIAVPLGIQKHDFQFGHTYTLKIGAGDTDFITDSMLSPGWFGALALGSSGASTYEANLTNGYKGALRIGDVIDIENGNMSGPTKKAIEDRIASEPYATIDNFSRDSKRLITVPVIEAVNKQQVRIIGFSVFLLEDYVGSGNNSYVKGTFVQTVISGEVSSTGPDYGLAGVRLSI